MAFVTPVVEHLLEKRNSSMGPPLAIDPTTHRTMSRHSTTATSRCHTFNRSEYNKQIKTNNIRKIMKINCLLNAVNTKYLDKKRTALFNELFTCFGYIINF